MTLKEGDIVKWRIVTAQFRMGRLVSLSSDKKMAFVNAFHGYFTWQETKDLTLIYSPDTIRQFLE